MTSPTDFVHDQPANGRRFRALTVIDDVTGECLAAVPETSITGRRVVREMTTLIARRGKPGAIVSDNGTEFTSAAVLGFLLRPALRRQFVVNSFRTCTLMHGPCASRPIMVRRGLMFHLQTPRNDPGRLSCRP